MRTVRRLLAWASSRHWLTWCVMLLGVLALTLIVVPGEYVGAQFFEPASDWERYCKEFYQSTYESHYKSVQNSESPHVTVQVIEHGWPLPFLLRALVMKDAPSGKLHRKRSTPLIRFPSRYSHWGGSTYHDVAWSNYDNWPLDSDEWRLRPGSLAIDVVVGLLIVAVIGTVAEWRIRRGGTGLRFRTADLLAGITVIATLLGIYTYHSRLQRLEAAGGSPPLPPGFHSHDRKLTSSQKYFGPTWLRKLVGHPDLIPFMHHVNAVSINSSTDEEVFEHLTKLPYLESVHFGDDLPLAAIGQLKACRRLEDLGLPHLSAKSRRRKLDPSEPVFTVADLPSLKELSLISIELSGDEVQAEHVDQVAALPTIRRLSLQKVSATADEVDMIRKRHPNVTIVVQPNWGLFLSD